RGGGGGAGGGGGGGGAAGRGGGGPPAGGRARRRFRQQSNVYRPETVNEHEGRKGAQGDAVGEAPGAGEAASRSRVVGR
ncbi:hypothetical protein I6A84_09750, partial [Frankia sp. CNm7]